MRGWARASRPIPLHGLLLVAVMSFLAAGLGPNGGLGLLAVAVLAIGSALLWRPGEPPILLAILGYQWLQASIAIFHASWLGVDVDQLAETPGSTGRATVLTLIGLGVVAIGMRIGAGPASPRTARRARDTAGSLAVSRLALLYAVAAMVSLAGESLAATVPAATQPLLALRTLKWAAYFVLTFAALVQPDASRLYWLMPFLLELLLGVGAFFSDFKTVLLVTALAGAAAGRRPTKARLVMLVAGAMLAIGLGVVWSSVKSEYRMFVSRGEASQAVLVDYPERIAKLAALTMALDGEALAKGADALLKRLSYVELLGAVLDVVPRAMPHEDGAILWDAVRRPLMPRLLFPEKAPIDDSARTRHFTDGAVTDSGATSISLGYIAEAYIDFGDPLMMAALLAIGCVYGRIYAGFSYRGRGQGLAGMAMATAVLMEGLALETSLTKVAGGMAVAWLVAFAALRLLVPVAMPGLLNRRTR